MKITNISCQNEMRLKRLDFVTNVLRVLLLLQLHVGKRNVSGRKSNQDVILIKLFGRQ
jgi:hypothetical protein